MEGTVEVKKYLAGAVKGLREKVKWNSIYFDEK